MNENLEALITQVIDENDAGDMVLMLDMLAELVVKECATHLRFLADEAGANELEEHFGLKERK